MRSLLMMSWLLSAPVAMAAPCPFPVYVVDAWSRGVDDATVVCEPADAGHWVEVTRAGFLPTRILGGTGSTLVFLRRPGDWWLANGQHQVPFVPELDKLLVEVNDLVAVRALLPTLGLVETDEHIPAEVLSPIAPFRGSDFGTSRLVVARVDGRPFSAQEVPELARLRASRHVRAAGPLIHRVNVRGRSMGVGHVIHLQRMPSVAALAPFVRDYGVVVDVNTVTLTLRPSIGLQAVLVANALTALSPASNPELVIMGLVESD